MICLDDSLSQGNHFFRVIFVAGLSCEFAPLLLGWFVMFGLLHKGKSSFVPLLKLSNFVHFLKIFYSMYCIQPSARSAIFTTSRSDGDSPTYGRLLRLYAALDLSSAFH